MFKYSIFIILLVSCKEKSPEEKSKKILKNIKNLKTLNLSNLKNTEAGLKLVPKLKLKKAQTAIEKKEFEKALEIYDEISKMKNINTQTRLQIFAGRANCYFYMKKYEEAVTAWEKVIAIRKNNTFALRNLAFVYQEWGKLPKAFRALRKVIEIKPEVLISRIDLIKMMEQMGSSKEELKKEVDQLYATRNKLVEKLKSDKIDKKTIYEYLGILLEVPGNNELNTLKFNTLEPFLKHKSSLIRIRTGKLAAKTQKGKKYLAQMAEKQKDPGVKKAWQKVLKEE
ncbi:MAG: tetratricopeptide repeat protein [Deltaproteobacteria bacterium]|jgi:tetratricopeptide (TPR) repeat protein|nr:tetratricopeptide repeat protein [Deltaproteobacteria bacterium]